MSWYRQQLEDWLKTLDVKAHTVYDIGGQQGSVKDRVRSWDVDRYEILDLPAFNIETSEIVYESADIVFCLEVFEYLVDPLTALKNITTILTDNGKAYITFAFIYPHHNELELEGLRYTEPGIKRLAKSVGLEVSNIWYRRDRSGLLQQFYAADGMHPAKEYANHDTTGFIVEFTK